MGLPAQQRRFSITEYLELELTAEERYEYQDGEILAMSGGSLEQSLITANIVRESGNALKGRPCRVAESNLRVGIPATSRYVYPDALIFCGSPEFDPRDILRHTLLNPRIIIEVLSPSTEAYDRGDKFTHYRRIESFEEYILISQDRPNVESILRQPDSAWSFQHQTGLDAAMTIRSLGIEIAMIEIYAGVEWPTPAAADRPV